MKYIMTVIGSSMSMTVHLLSVGIIFIVIAISKTVKGAVIERSILETVPGQLRSTFRIPEKIEFLGITSRGIEVKYIYDNASQTCRPNIESRNVLVEADDVIAFDVSKHYVFWATNQNYSIFKTKRNGSGGRTSLVVNTSGQVTSLAAEWKNELVYFIQEYYIIKVIDYNGKKGIRTLYTESNRAIELINLVISPKQTGMLYTIQSTHIRQKINQNDINRILCVPLNGAHIELTIFNAVGPSLAYNYERDILVWSSRPSKNVVEFCEWNKKCITVNILSTGNESIETAVEFAYINNYIFWNFNSNNITSLGDCALGPKSKDGALAELYVQESNEHFLADYSEKYEVPYIPIVRCKLNCTHYCTSSIKHIGGECACPDEYILDQHDKATCRDKAFLTDHHGYDDTRCFKFVELVATSAVTVAVVITVVCIIMFLKRCYKDYRHDKNQDLFTRRLPPKRKTRQSDYRPYRMRRISSMPNISVRTKTRDAINNDQHLQTRTESVQNSYEKLQRSMFRSRKQPKPRKSEYSRAVNSSGYVLPGPVVPLYHNIQLPSADNVYHTLNTPQDVGERISINTHVTGQQLALNVLGELQKQINMNLRRNYN